MEDLPRLEVHYYLKDESHSMDALVRNRCEAEFLSAVTHITRSLGAELRFEATLPSQGGFRDIWRVLTDKENQPTVGLLLPVVLALLNHAVTIFNSPPKPNPELERQQLQINQLTIDHWKLENQRSELEIKKLQRENSPEKEQDGKAVAPRVDTAGVANALAAPPASSLGTTGVVRGPSRSETEAKPLQTDPKVVASRSNFYKQLVAYDRVTAVGFRCVPIGRPVPEESVVTRASFDVLIAQPNTLEPEVSETRIEIVSPVISGGDMKWKGRLNREPISFSMNDKAFKSQVFQNEVGFQHGDSILCVLETDRELDEAGNVRVKGHRVTLVLDKIDGSGVSHETPQGRRKRTADKHPHPRQADLFADERV